MRKSDWFRELSILTRSFSFDGVGVEIGSSIPFLMQGNSIEFTLSIWPKGRILSRNDADATRKVCKAWNMIISARFTQHLQSELLLRPFSLFPTVLSAFSLLLSPFLPSPF